MNIVDGILQSINDLTKRMKRLESQGIPRWVYLSAPLTSTSWDGDAYSTTAKTKIDLSAVFSAPAGIKAVLVRIMANDSASASTSSGCWIILSPNNTAGSGVGLKLAGLVHDAEHEQSVIVPCDANGDIYYQINASGASTMDIYLQIWGYVI